MSPHYMWNAELAPFLTPRSGPFEQSGKLRSRKGWDTLGLGPGLTRADVEALPVLLQPLDPLLQFPKQCVIQQQLLTLGGDSRSARGTARPQSHPTSRGARPRWLTSRCCLAPWSSHSYLFLITSRQKPL